MTVRKFLSWLWFSALFCSLLLTTSCRKTVNHDSIINGNPEILKQFKVNILYLDGAANPLRTYYDQGKILHRHSDMVEGYANDQYATLKL